MDSATTLDAAQIATIIMQLLGGLALFLFGMEQMTTALKSIAGRGMKTLLSKLTTNRFTGVIAGALVTAIIQSSSVTTVLVVGFISAGLLTLTQSLGIILGADIGTTITAQIISFKITHYALILLAVGFGLQFIFKQEKIRNYGLMIMGLGMIFFGMNLMSEATHPLRTYQPFIELMQRLDNILLGILVGTLFTAIIQSSSATIGVIIVLAGQGLISLEAAIALALGANIGTSVTALLASIGAPREAVRAAVAHVIFKVVGVIIWFPFINQLVWFVQQTSDELTRQVANAHTTFNVINTFIFIWFVTPFAALMRWLIPEKPVPQSKILKPRYLDDTLFETPELALHRVRLELDRLGVYTLSMVRKALPLMFEGTPEELTALADMDDNVDTLYGAIVTYLGQLSQENLLGQQSEQLSNYMEVANDIENIGDMIETNLVEAGNTRLQYNLHVSETTQVVLSALHQQVYWAVERALEALAASDKGMAEEVMAAKVEINRLANDAESHLVHRLTAAEPNRLATFRLESEIIEYLKRVYYFAKRIAKVTADTNLTYKQVEIKHVPREYVGE